MNKSLFSKNTTVIFFNEHPQPIQRMLDYDWLVKRETPSIVAIINPTKAGWHRCFWGATEIMVPMFMTVSEAAKKFPDADVLVSFASQRSAFLSAKEALETKTIRTVAITAEGMPENESRELIRIAKQNDKWIIGPATVGAIKAGEFRIGNTGGTIENIIESKLYRAGSVGVVTVSGGMSNEIYNIVSNNTDGVYEGIAVGGDKFPGSSLAENLLRLSQDKNVKMLVLLGEIGLAPVDEILEVAKKIKQPIVVWVSGTVAKLFKTEVQFGHAGARSGTDRESSQAINKIFKDAGMFVPESFNDFGKLINKIFKEKVGNMKNNLDGDYREPPMDYTTALKQGLVRRENSIVSSISDDRGDEPTYNKKEISEYADKSIGNVINALWFKGKLNKVGEEFVELAIKMSADHGPAVATAHNAIVTARSGKDIVDSVIAGLTTIGPRHGGAIDGAAKWAYGAVKNNLEARDVVDDHKQRGEMIMGIGHRIKTAQNPDVRVQLLKKFAQENLKKTIYLDFALQVERETLKKKNTLILNVDGAIGVIFLDILSESGLAANEIAEIIEIGSLNAIFVLGRTIGMIGHALDQKRLQEGLYRHPWDDISYI